MAAYGAMPIYRVQIALCLLAYGIVFAVAGEISDLQKCADRNCEVTLSRARALSRHTASSPVFLDFNRNDIIEVKSKSAGSRPDLWGGELNGRRGYFPKAYVKEFEVLEKDPMFEVATKDSDFAKKIQSKERPASNKERPASQEPVPVSSSPDPQLEGKDEMEVDETDLTGSEDIDAVFHANVLKDSPTLGNVLETGQTNRDETELEEGDPASFKDPLLREIEALHKSFQKMSDMQQDPSAFNEFLANKFGTESTDFTSTAEKDASKSTEQPPQENPDTSESEPGVGFDDETDLDTDDDDFLFPSNLDREARAGPTGNEATEKVTLEEPNQQVRDKGVDSQKQADSKKSKQFEGTDATEPESAQEAQGSISRDGQEEAETQKQDQVKPALDVNEDKKKEEDSPYISGVRELEVNDEDEEEEEEVEGQGQQSFESSDTGSAVNQKSANSLHDEPEENEVEEVSIKQDETETDSLPTEKYTTDLLPDDPDLVTKEDSTEKTVDKEIYVPDLLPDDPDLVTKEDSTEKETVDKEKYQNQSETEGNKVASTWPPMTPDVSLADIPVVTSSDDSISKGVKPNTETADPKIGVDSSIKTSDDEEEGEETEKTLHFKSWLGDQDDSTQQGENVMDQAEKDLSQKEKEEIVDKMDVQDEEEMPKATATLGKVNIEDGEVPESTETPTEKAVDDAADNDGIPDASSSEPSVSSVTSTEPHKAMQQPPLNSAIPAHKAVDIDFIQPSGAHVQDSSAELETSQTDPGKEYQAQTPILQGTPSLQQVPQSESSDLKVLPKAQPTQTEQSEDTDETTTVIDGTTFNVVDGEIADIVPESVGDGKGATVRPQDPVMSAPPTQSTVMENVLPSAVPPTMPEVSAWQQDVKSQRKVELSLEAPNVGLAPQIPEVQNITEGDAVRPDTKQKDKLSPEDTLQRGVGAEQYQTNADFLSRKVLSVGQTSSQVPTPPKAATAQPVPPVQQQTQKVPEPLLPSGMPQPAVQESPVTTDTLTEPSPTVSDIQPSVSVDSRGSSVTIEGNEENSQEGKAEKSVSGEDYVAPPLAFDLPPAESMVHGGGGSKKEKEAEQTGQSTITQTPDNQEWDGIPPPPASDQSTPPPDDWKPDQENQDQANDEPTLEGDPYQMDDYFSRKINDDDLTKTEEEAAAYGSRQGTVMGSLEAQTKTFIDKLPPSLQSLLEQEPLGLSPVMTVLVTMTTLAMFLCMACVTCLCSGGKKTGKKDTLVVVRELEERLLMAVKEKENLEDMLQERQSESSRMKEELSGLQHSSTDYQTDLQNFKLHNEALKGQVESLQTEVVELQDQLSRKSDDVKSKDKKTKDIEKETKKVNEAKAKLEKDLQKKETQCRRLEDENESLKSTIQSLTDQVQLLDTSKQQLLSEAEDWKEKVEELKERLDQLEMESKQAQETISFKDNELEVMKDCYLQLKAFEKEGGQGEDEEYDTGDSKVVQEKIQSMMDVSKVNATLRAVQEEKDSLENKLKIENDARKELEEQLECVRREMESSMADKMKAERQCQEAQTKLSVLSSYFKEKELQLQRELGEQEALKKQNLSRLDNADESYRSMSKELELSKQQVESLKRELNASERDFRSQIAANEKKAHENWLNARAAERELKEARHEAAVMRQKLTDIERRQMGPGGLIRPLPTRGMPPPGMLNGPPPPPGMERSPSRGSLPPGVLPPGPPPPPFRDDDFLISQRDRQRLPPSHPLLHTHPEARSPPPRMPPPDGRGSPPRLPPPDARSPPPRIPPPYDRRGPPHPMDSRSPPMRLPPPDMVPPLRGHLPPHMAPPPMGSPVPRDSPRDGYSPRDGRPGQSPRDPYGRQPPPGGERRHQSHV